MKGLAILLVLSFCVEAFPCAACSKNASTQISNNIQSSPGNGAKYGFAEARAARGTTSDNNRSFKNDKVFDSVGKDQGEANSNWNSSTGD